MSRSLVLALCAAGSVACSVPPPGSQMPNAQAAIDRLRATTACGNAIQAEATIDHFGKERFRANLMLFAARPARVRLDAMSSFVGTVGTLWSDGDRFAFDDRKNNRFLVGPSSACNIARLTRVPVPGSVLVDLLRGSAPILKHEAQPTTITWSGSGYYVVTLASTRDAREELHVAPHPEDFGKPWSEQRLRVLDVQVWQKDVLLYHAELAGHAPAAMAKEQPVDAEGQALGETPVPVSGPQCTADIARTLHVTVPALDEDVIFRYDKVTWNPPLPQSTFLPAPTNAPMFEVKCDE